MNYQGAIDRIWRHSDGALPDERARLKELVRYATLAPSGHNTQCWRFRIGNRSIEVLPDLSRRTPVVDPDDHHLYVSLGCAAENLIQAARAFGYGGHGEFIPADDGAITIALERTTAERSPLFQAIPYRQCTRTDYDGRPLTAEELQLLEVAGTGQGVALVLLTTREAMETVLEYVVEGNTMQVGNPAFVRELEHWIRFSDSEAIRTGDGLPARATGNPPAPRWLGRLLFRTFFRARPENDKYARQIRSSAGIGVFGHRQTLSPGTRPLGRRGLHQPGVRHHGRRRPTLFRQVEQSRIWRTCSPRRPRGLRRLHRQGRSACPNRYAMARRRPLLPGHGTAGTGRTARPGALRGGAGPDAPAYGRALRLAPGQHHRCHAPDQCLARRLDRLLARAAPGPPDRPGRKRGSGSSLQEAVRAVMDALPAFFDGYRPVPSVLHGDLWSGNWDADREGNPVIYDPAVYFGDRETDLAMTELFGGPGSRFHDAYHDTWPIDPGYGVRKDLYNLYHLLNHFNLFGGGYAGQSERLAQRLIAAAR
jgi:hypothetical protein